MNARTTYGGHPTRSAYENTLADRIRAELIEWLGGECHECGERSNLEFDHPFGRSWKPKKLCRYRRHLRYRKEARSGLLRLLCADCNKTLPPQRGTPPPTPDPGSGTTNPF